MKKPALSICFFFLFPLLAFSQYDPKAEKILSEMSKKYKSFKTFKADFSYSMESPSAGNTETIKGEIFVKADKFKLDLGNQEVINNGTTIWTYLKEENEVNVSNYEPDPNDITPNNIYTIYQKGYKYLLLEENTTTQVVDLIPEDKAKKVFKIRISVNKKDKTIKNWKMFEKNGNRYTYSILKFIPNPPGVDDKFFIFDKTKYKGVEVVDLR